MNNHGNKKIYFAFTIIFLVLFIFSYASFAKAQDTAGKRAHHVPSVYDTIQQQQDQQPQDQQPELVTPATPVTPADTQTPVTVPIKVTPPPVQKTPHVTATPAPTSAPVVAPKKAIFYNIMRTFIPSDPYLARGFRPMTTKILYGVSALIGLAGLILVIGRPRFIARRLAALFNFS